ncbi:hypothetical protein [uncultured Kordia sp.]|uniref:hypothetical protein n=1 Tax=uncultured Kordia sp. TaxID=507699 RepID=UPI002639E24B|nr:hypothetical protein [uncultured Kordia sp.]
MGLINIILISIISKLILLFASAEMNSDAVAVKQETITLEVHSTATEKSELFTWTTFKNN